MAASRQLVDKAIGDANRGKILSVRAAGDCAWLKTYRACGLLFLEKGEPDAAGLVAEHVVADDTEVDEEIELTNCTLHPDGKGLLKMDDSVLMVVTKGACILQSEHEGAIYQVHFEAKGDRMTWLNGEEHQVEFRSDAIIVHLGRKLHVILETDKEATTVLYDEGPVQQVTLTDDGRAGVRLREKESDAPPPITVEQAKERKAEVCTARDAVKEMLPAVKEAITAAEAMGEKAKSGYDAAMEKEKAFKDERAKAKSKDEVVDVALEGGYLAKVSSKRVELVQLPDKFGSAQLQWAGDGEWTWGCNGGIMSTRADGTALVKLTDDVSSEVNSKLKVKIMRVQLMPTEDRIVAFEDGSRLQLMKGGEMSLIRGPTVVALAEGYCTLAGDGKRSKLEDCGDFIHEEDSGLSWALKDDELVILSAGHSFPKTDEAPKEASPKKRGSKRLSQAPVEEKKEAPKCETGKVGLVEDAVSAQPLASAAVRARALSTSKSGFSAECVADGDGRFDLERSEDVVLTAEKEGYAPDMARVSAKTEAICLRPWPLAFTEKFKSQDGFFLKHEHCRLRVQPGAVMSDDGSPHTGSARLELGLPSPETNLAVYVGLADDEKEKDAALTGPVSITLETLATIRDGAPFPAVWTLDADAAREHLPTRARKSFLFRSTVALPGVYTDLATSRSMCLDVEIAVGRILKRQYQDTAPGRKLDEPRVYVAVTAIKLLVCGIVEVASDDVPKVTPFLLEEAKKESLLQSALQKAKIQMMKEIRIDTTFETVLDWMSTGIYIDSIELPAVDEDTLMRAHAEVNLVRELKQVAAKLSRAGTLPKECEAASKLKHVPGSLSHLASACSSLFSPPKLTADKIGGWNHFHKQVKTGLLGQCSKLDPYRISPKIIKRTQQLAKFEDEKLHADYPGAAFLGNWLREFVKCATALDELGVAVKDDKMGNPAEHDFLDVASPVPALTALRDPPLTKEGVRLVQFVAPSPGWWTVDFDSGRAAGGGVAAARALAST